MRISFEYWNVISQLFPPIAGVFAAGHDEKIEWMIVKGIAGYGDRSQSSNYEEWMSFASAMAASVVAKVLADPFVFQEWPHYNSGTCSKSGLSAHSVEITGVSREHFPTLFISYQCL